jgi:hypothetical protein
MRHDSGFIAERLSYSAIADEYYDQRRHPTCANFRQACRIALREFYKWPKLVGVRICELGAGKSIVAELMLRAGVSLARLTISDKHREMLRFSEGFVADGAKLALMDAERLPRRQAKFDLVFAMMADPYNTSSFWKALPGILAKGGAVTISTPSFEWASRFRRNAQDGELAVARFKSRSGRLLDMPSHVYTVVDQIGIARRSGFVLSRYRAVQIRDLGSVRLSPKLLGGEGDLEPIVDVYEFQLRQQAARGGAAPL